jgi:hypothetical protein
MRTENCTLNTQREPQARTVLNNRLTLENVIVRMSRNVGSQLKTFITQHPRSGNPQHVFLSLTLKKGVSSAEGTLLTYPVDIPC